MKIPQKYDSRKLFGLLLTFSLVVVALICGSEPKVWAGVWVMNYLIYVGGNILAEAVYMLKLVMESKFGKDGK